MVENNELPQETGAESVPEDNEHGSRDDASAPSENENGEHVNPAETSAAHEVETSDHDGGEAGSDTLGDNPPCEGEGKYYCAPPPAGD